MRRSAVVDWKEKEVGSDLAPDQLVLHCRTMCSVRVDAREREGKEGTRERHGRHRT